MAVAHDRVIEDDRAVKIGGATDWIVADGDEVYVGADDSVSSENNLFTVAEGERLSRNSTSWVISEGTSYLRKVIRPVPYLGDLADVDTVDAEAGQVLAYDGESDWNLARPSASAKTVETKDDDYTLVTADAGKIILMDKATAQTVTIDGDLDLEPGQEITIIQTGAGEVDFADDDATVTPSDLVISGQYAAATVLCVAEDDYLLLGFLTNPNI